MYSRDDVWIIFQNVGVRLSGCSFIFNEEKESFAYIDILCNPSWGKIISSELNYLNGKIKVTLNLLLLRKITFSKVKFKRCSKFMEEIWRDIVVYLRVLSLTCYWKELFIAYNILHTKFNTALSLALRITCFAVLKSCSIGIA